MLATLQLMPGFQTSVMALATLWAPSVQKWRLYENGKSFENRERWEKMAAGWKCII